MNLTIERPLSLSEQYSADVARLRRTERDAILARHRVVFQTHRLAEESRTAQLHEGIFDMTTRKKALFSEVATATARLAAARQSLEDAKFLARTCMAGDGPIVFALHVERGAFGHWLKVSEAFQACQD